ncbi:MAG: hypothetical protein GWN84_07685 [Gammaproteobacteria bacterium]|nr:hypothetical protein [Gammaproteobacteria bacterium]NIR82763.1 hypothetical protein [Gammaproteobacteria bacterium]NIR89627.1 hypothetical protein [Gammaproteobacteria bacterium]NIU03923.1 hypothetical protein [Gammaproteobacteria bacterium]NIV51239.1 hypothetical protein [Gammaproteobacteria bacterium]
MNEIHSFQEAHQKRDAGLYQRAQAQAMLFLYEMAHGRPAPNTEELSIWVQTSDEEWWRLANEVMTKAAAFVQTLPDPIPEEWNTQELEPNILLGTKLISEDTT